jgi:hypothetical protein
MKAHIQPSSFESAYFHRFSGRLTVAVIVAGFILSLVQFLFNRSLWWDEAALALNIIHRSSAELLQPLDNLQAAPILFLQIEKLFSVILPDSEYGLRLFPLLCFWASLYFFRQILKKLLDPYGVLIALSLFVFGYQFLYFSSEVKQYMSDVFTALCMFWLMLKNYKDERNKYILTTLSGAVAIFLSNVAPVILFTCGVYWTYDRFFVTRRRSLYPLIAVFAVWLGVFALYYAFFIHDHPLRDFMLQCWHKSFLPLHPFKADFYLFLLDRLSMFFMILYNFETYAMRLIWKIFFGLFFMTGVVALVKNRKTDIMIFAFTPLLLHLSLSALQLYPFHTRVILYSVPGVIIVFAYGLDGMIRLIGSRLKKKKIRMFATITVCLLFAGILFLIQGFPFKQTETKDSIKFLQEKIENRDEKIYVSVFQFPVFKYYTDIGILSVDVNFLGDMQYESTYKMLNNNEINEYLGSWMLMNKDTRNRLLLNHLKTLRGRNWLLLGWTKKNDERKEIDLINSLDSLGYHKMDEFKTVKSSVYLYDFGE